jgi:Peptidase family M1 domain
MPVLKILAGACICLLAAGGARAQPAQPGAAQVDGITRLVAAIEEATQAGDADALRALARPSIRQAQLSDFVQSLTLPKVARATVKERDRAPADGRVRVLLEILTERDIEGRVTTWRADVEPVKDIDGPWRIASVERLTMVSGLYRLALDASAEYEVRNLVINEPDLALSLPAGHAFVARTPEGPTALVLLGRGRMDFAPKPESERGQVRIFSGADALKTDFDAIFIRINPAEFDERIARAALTARATVDGGRLRRATQLFEAQVAKSFQLDLNDLSTARWSLLPGGSDFVAEIVTGRFGPLTYARANGEPEDISFFDRRRHRNIAVYPSDAKLATRGRFFSEDEKLEYDVTRYELETSFAPERLWVDGTARLTIHVRSASLSTLTLRLADALVVRSITSPQFGRLLHLRVVGQNNVLVGFPGTIVSDTDVDLVVTYGGRLLPQGIDREAIALQEQNQVREDTMLIPLEPVYTYSNRSYWYPQSPVTDYATARMTITVPGDLDVIASGTPVGPSTVLPAPPGQRGRKRFVFEAAKPTRYLSVLISRFQMGTPTALKLQDDDDPVTLTVAANPRQSSRLRPMGEKAAEILKFYASLIADAPYGSFTLALTESDLPGGHSPAYFAMLNQPMPTSPFVWANDPVSFPNYPSFFIAHELAHQWWGQAVGWKNYHEQWISEGFAQYFAALYAERERGPEQFASVLRQMRKWAIDMSPQGPVYLGYRLGHIKSDGKVFRALVYNKGAMVLHMLRRLLGDDAFYSGLRDFYATWRYKKAGTDDFRAAMEKAGGRPLERFFDRWIFGSAIPTLRFSSTVDGTQLRVRFEQTGEVFDVPITVTIAYADGTSEDVIVAVTDKVTERTLPLKGPVRGVDANRDNGALAEIQK